MEIHAESDRSRLGSELHKQYRLTVEEDIGEDPENQAAGDHDCAHRR
jgi:hypothetical protein